MIENLIAYEHDRQQEALEMARLSYDMTGYCPEKGRSHDSRPCCVCGKTIFDDGTSSENGRAE